MDMKRLAEEVKATFLRHPLSPRCDGEREGDSKPTLVIGEESLCRTRPYYFRRCKRVMPTNIESLPSELLSDILLLLPADYLHDRASLVCRRWYHIIRSDAFVNKQIQHSTYGLLLSCSEERYNHPIFMTATQGRVEISDLSYESKTRLFNGWNGLALERVYHEVNNRRSILLIRNPATKQSLVPPPLQPNIRQDLCCIAFAASSMKYKLVVPSLTGDWRTILILTVGVDNSWRNVEMDQVPQSAIAGLLHPPFITEGFMHWGISRMGGPILTMDVETEIVSMRRPPSRRGFSGKYYLSTGRFLSLLVGYRRDLLWEIWEMKSETGEWRKVLPDMKLGGLFHKYASKGLVPFGWVKYPEVLAFRFRSNVRDWENCILYNRETHEINFIGLPYSCMCYSSFVHKNNLTSLV